MRILLSIAASLLLLISTRTMGMVSHDFGQHIVHCQIVASDTLSAEMAQKIGVQPNTSSGVITIAVVEPAQSESSLAIPAKVKIHWDDSHGMMSTIVMHPVQMDDGVYYIGQFNISKAATMTFNILISLDNHQAPYTLTVRDQQFQ